MNTAVLRIPRPHRSALGYLVAAASTAAATASIAALSHVAHIPTVSLLYIPAILTTAVYFGLIPSLLAALLAFLQYDFFLVQPLYTLNIEQAGDALALAIFVLVAVLTSRLAAGARERAEAAQRRATESNLLYHLGQALMAAHDVPHVLEAITRQIVEVFDVDRCAILIPNEDNLLHLAAQTVRGGRRDRISQATSTWVYEQGTEIGLAGEQNGTRDPERLHIPLRTADQVLGVMEVGRRHSGAPLSPDERRMVTSFAAQAALVVGHAQSEGERQRLQVAEESDRLKSALLNAVSHDLRTPLASIKASATTLLLSDSAWTMEEGRELLQAIDAEADRLNRLVRNLLDLSQIEAGVLHPALDWYYPGEVLDGVRSRLSTLVEGRPLTIDLGSNLPAIPLDLLRIEELLMNLVENAVKYSPPGSPLEIRAWLGPETLSLAVVDHGPGIPQPLRERVFDTFFRVQQHGDHHPGTGLGLAICRGVAQAHGGSIRIESTPGGGATFVVMLPLSQSAAPVPA